MKLKSLLLTSACLCALGVTAQTNYAPENWRFDNMEAGACADIFLPEVCGGGWNCPAPFNAYDGDGGIAIATGGVGATANDWGSMTDDEKAYLQDFFDNARIVTTTLNYDDGTTAVENILCLVGNNPGSLSYPGGQARTNSFPNPALFWISGNENSATPLEVGKNYRLTFDYRVICPNDDVTGALSMTIADNSYNGIDQNTGLGNGSYRQGDLPIYGSLSSYWSRGIFDFMLLDNNAPDYHETPIAVKMYIAGGLMDNCIFLFRTPKLEQIATIDAANVPVNINEYPPYNDTPGASVEQIAVAGTTITAAKGTITVIDAKEAIEVYNISGVKVAAVKAPATVETIDLDMNGVFIVKTGNKVQKVIL